MGLLVSIQLHSPDADAQRTFYEQQLGLTGTTSKQGTQFETQGAMLAVRAASAGETAFIELLIRAADLDAKVTALAAHGIHAEGAIESSPQGPSARFRDPEGNAIRLTQLRENVTHGSGPRVSHVFVNTLTLAECARFYREILNLKVANESEHWIEFDTGETRLALHARHDAEGLPLHPDQRISFALHRDDFDAWTEELRGRGVRFAAAPVEEELGVIAEVEDADGWCVVLHGPASFDDARDDAAYDEDNADTRGSARIGDEDPASGPGFGSRKQSKKRRDKLVTRALHAFQRGDGGIAPRGLLPREPREPRS